MDELNKLYRLVVFKTLLFEMVECETLKEVSYVCETHETVQEVSNVDYEFNFVLLPIFRPYLSIFFVDVSFWAIFDLKLKRCSTP